MSDGTCSIPGEVLLYPSIPGEVLLYPSIKPPPPGVPVNALAATQILLDLIAELRHRHTPYRVCMECDDWYAGCEDHEHITVCLWCCTSHGYHSMDCADNHTGATLAEHCVTVGMADRAEADLRELWKRGRP